MIKHLMRVVLTTVLMASPATADPIKLKLSLVTSDRALIYTGIVKPFVDAVNAEGAGLVEIDIYFSGALEKQPAFQPQLVADGKADLAFIFPGYSPDRFYDNTVVELPGLFKTTREASLIYTQLIAAGTMKGYDDYVVIAALCSPPESIHSRQPIETLADLKGMSVRTNNPTEASALAKLGMRPVPMPVNSVADALSDGKIASATAPLAMLPEFGIARVATSHYMLQIGAAPLALVMNRARFDGLPARAQEIIRKHSGVAAIDGYVSAYDAAGRVVMEQLRSSPRRLIVTPSPADQAAANAQFEQVIEEWAERSSGNRAQLAIVREKLALLRGAR